MRNARFFNIPVSKFLRERPADHKPGDGIGPSPDRPENAEATQKMIEKKTFGPTKSFLGGTKTFGCSKSFFLTSFTKTFPVSSTIQCSNVLTTCLLHLQCLRNTFCHPCAWIVTSEGFAMSEKNFWSAQKFCTGQETFRRSKSFFQQDE